MPEVVQRVEALILAIDEVLGSAPMQRKPREMLEKIKADAWGIKERLVDLHENWCALDVAPRRPYEAARGQWLAISDGRHQGAEPEIQSLVRTSPTLDAMRKAGVNFLSICKFDAGQCQMASAIGDHFEDWQLGWDRFKNALARGDNKFEFLARDFELVQTFLDAMVRVGAVESYETWMYSHRDKKWATISPKKIRYLNVGQPIGVVFVRGRLSAFAGGDWLTAYAFQIMDDHLSRHTSDYEIYSQVQYEAPPDVLRVSGDFDVLTCAGQKALLIECKSGRIRTDHGRNDFTEIAAKAQGFKRVLEKVRADVVEIEFLLVFNPYLNEPEQIHAGFEGSGVRPIRPDEIRGTITEVFSGLRAPAAGRTP